MARLLDRLNGANSSGPAFQRLWQRNCDAVEGANADLQDQIDAIAAMNDDNTLTPVEKPVWVFMNSFLTGEQAGLDAQATSYGITTEKTAYDTAITDLTTYLATLVAPVAWDNLTGNTAIVGPTFRSKFNDVLTTKQALINAITAAAKALADAAQTQANTATTNAATAQTTADTVKKTDKISGSATAPSQVLSATDAGTNATITIAGHSRIYGDNTTLAGIAGGSITALTYSTLYAVYYDDPTTASTAPTYAATTTLKTAMPNYVDGRHYMGQITTPAAAAGPTGGGGVPPGGGGPYP